MHNSNPIKKAVIQEIERRTRKIRVLPNDNSAMRLITAILKDIDENGKLQISGLIGIIKIMTNAKKVKFTYMTMRNHYNCF